ncbi:MAG: hypothetical protein HKP10_01185 [Kiritimatiellales bacterium]|nr:hypothetical protein [Kiritimatiellales bacterium]
MLVCESLVSTAFTPLASGIVATPSGNTFINTSSADSMWFYQVELE